MRVARPSKTALVFLGFFSILSLFLIPRGTNAQTAGPHVVITWHAGQSYVPPGYVGKALPGGSSLISASLEILSGGKPADLSGLPIYWYLNDDLVANGIGKQSISFTSLNPGQIMQLRVQIPNYPSGEIIKTILIPVVNPKAVIVAPYPLNSFPASPAHLTVLPYFFSILSPASLSFSWTVNGTPENIPENPSEADIAIPQGTPSGSVIPVSIDVTNPLDSTVASASLSLTYAQ